VPSWRQIGKLGVHPVSGVKRIMISIPEKLLEEVDGLASVEKRNRSEFIGRR
jgi:metal-responsive CopG/Arc/MetJ family transcriptional regulator